MPTEYDTCLKGLNQSTLIKIPNMLTELLLLFCDKWAVMYCQIFPFITSVLCFWLCNPLERMQNSKNFKLLNKIFKALSSLYSSPLFSGTDNVFLVRFLFKVQEMNNIPGSTVGNFVLFPMLKSEIHLQLLIACTW